MQGNSILRCMSEETFENLEVWQDAVELAASVHERVHACRNFVFRDQISRAALSVSSNIAEGYERDTNAELIRFLFIAKGSCGEVRSQAFVGRRINVLSEGDSEFLILAARRLSKRLKRLIDARRTHFE